MKNIIYGEANETDIADLVQLLSLLFNIEKDFNPDTSKQQKGLELLLKSNATATIQVAKDDTGKVIGIDRKSVV